MWQSRGRRAWSWIPRKSCSRWCWAGGRARSGVARCTCHLRGKGVALLHLEESRWCWAVQGRCREAGKQWGGGWRWKDTRISKMASSFFEDIFSTSALITVCSAGWVSCFLGCSSESDVDNCDSDGNEDVQWMRSFVPVATLMRVMMIMIKVVLLMRVIIMKMLMMVMTKVLQRGGISCFCAWVKIIIMTVLRWML